MIDDDEEYTGSPLEIGPREFACPNPGCWLIHLRAAGNAACDSVPA